MWAIVADYNMTTEREGKPEILLPRIGHCSLRFMLKSAEHQPASP